MMKEIRCALVLTLFAGILSAVVPGALAQETDKNNTQTATADKTATEKQGTDKDATDKTATHQTATGNSSNRRLSGSGGSREMVFVPAVLKPVSARITLKLTENSRVIYEAIGNQAGVNVLFDPEYYPRPISV